MSLEPFVYLFVLLVLTALVLVGRLLNEKMREEINLRDLFSSPESPQETPDRERPGAPTPSRQEVQIPTTARLGPPNRRMRLKTALHNKRDLRQGIVLMTVLGPCRAFDSRSALPPTP
ncbi:MAG: hypothetical protein AB7P17_15610 [Nitrospirales bacterium]|nr:hypothetical protein [Nitrospirales bacterium]